MSQIHALPTYRTPRPKALKLPDEFQKDPRAKDHRFRSQLSVERKHEEWNDILKEKQIDWYLLLYRPGSSEAGLRPTLWYLVGWSHAVHLGHSCSSLRWQRWQGNHGKRQKIGVHFRQYLIRDLVPEAKNLSSEVKDLIKRILVPAEKRLTIEEIMVHPWMTKPAPQTKLTIDFKKMRNFSSFSKVVLFRFSSKQW